MVAALLGCAATKLDEQVEITSSPIIDGELDGGDPAAVAVSFAGVAYCSGTLVAARVVVTAAHCIHQQVPDAVVLGWSLEEDAPQVGVLFAREAAGFDPTDFSDDIGVLVLEHDAPMAPVTLASGPIDEHMLLGARVRIVGFGSTHDGGDVRGKYQGWARVRAVDETTFSISPDPAQPCTGDSGGPALLTIDGVETLIGVTSSGDAACESFATETRVDAYLSFVLASVEASTRAAASVGQPCLSPDACRVGRCYAPSDAPSFPYCAGRCVEARDCPVGMECIEDAARGGECRYLPPSPGALGGTCSSSACESGLCVQRNDGPAICALRCLPGVSSCPVGTRCDSVVEPAGLSACVDVPAEDAPAGCGIARSGPRGPTGPWPVTLLILSGWLLRSRRPHRLRSTR